MTAAEEDADAGHAPSRPSNLSRAEWLDVLKRAGKEFLDDGCTNLAKEVAYSSLLAFFPAAAFLLGLLGVLNLFDEVESFLGTVAPSGVISFIDGLRDDSGGSASIAALLVGGAGAVWAASGAMGAVMSAVNTAYDRFEQRPLWKRRAIALVLVVVVGASLVAAAVLLVFGAPIGHAIARRAHVGGAFTLAWSIARWPVAFVVILLLFTLIYDVAPHRERREWRWVTGGSLVGAVLWLILSALFTLYVTFAGSYSRTYGSLATGVILLLWLNYTAWAILFGAELNSELERRADVRAAGGEGAGLIRPTHRG